MIEQINGFKGYFVSICVQQAIQISNVYDVVIIFKQKANGQAENSAITTFSRQKINNFLEINTKTKSEYTRGVKFSSDSNKQIALRQTFFTQNKEDDIYQSRRNNIFNKRLFSQVGSRLILCSSQVNKNSKTPLQQLKKHSKDHHLPQISIQSDQAYFHLQIKSRTVESQVSFQIKALEIKNRYQQGNHKSKIYKTKKMMHLLKSYIHSDTSLLDAIQGKFKEQIIISIAMDDTQYEDEYINQLELIRPYLSEISFLELLIQKNLMIKYNNENKISIYLATKFFADLGDKALAKRIVFKDTYHSGTGQQNLQNLLLEFNYQQYVDWIFRFIGIIKNIDELDLNVTSSFINQENSSVFKLIKINKLNVYVEKQTNISHILSNLQQDSLKIIKVNVKDNTAQPKELISLQQNVFAYLDQHQNQSIREVVIYNVFDDMLAKPCLNGSLLSNAKANKLSMLSASINSSKVELTGKQKTEIALQEQNENQTKAQFTTKFLESILNYKNLQRLVLNNFILDNLCIETLKQIHQKQFSRDTCINSQNQSFQDFPLSSSHQSSQIIDQNKSISQNESQVIISKNVSKYEESKSQQNQVRTPQSIRFSVETSQLDVSKTLSNGAQKSHQLKSSKAAVFKSHALDGMIFQYPAKLESSKQIEKRLKKSHEQKSQFLELAETQSSSNDSTKKPHANGKQQNGNGYHHESKNSDHELQSQKNKLPEFVLFPQQQMEKENSKKYDLDEIPIFSIDSDQPCNNEEINQEKNLLSIVKDQQQDHQYPTPVFAEIEPEHILQHQQTTPLSITPRKSFEQQRKGSQTFLKHQSSKERSFNIDSSIPYLENQEENEPSTSQINHTKMQTSITSNQPIEYKLDQIDQIQKIQFTLSLKINSHNKTAAKFLIEFLQPKIKEIHLQLNEYDDTQLSEYISQDCIISKKLLIQWQYKLIRTPPLKSVEACNIFTFLRGKDQQINSLTLQLTNKKHFCPQTCQSLQDFISSHSSLKTFNFETCMFPSQMEFYKFLVCIAKSSIRHIEISGPKFEVLSDEAYLISPWKSYLNNRLRSLTIIGQNYSQNILNSFESWKMFRLSLVHLCPSPTLPLNIQKQIVSNKYLFGFSHKNHQPNNLAHQCYDKIHIIIAQFAIFSKLYYSTLSYSPELTFWDLFFD
ncbi:hypothetical protein ABPG72_021479 [Tetrahymena utriculariae]